ncbi:MAG: hypothetical protein IPM53_33725 [Anaerolineaceae bacterium]|nr:hypothetical protein [Anaerolineaceae bacterium]
MKLQRILNNIGWDGLLLGTAGISAIILSLLDFSTLIQLTPDPAIRIALSGIGLLLGAIVAQTASRRAEIQEIKNAIGVAESEVMLDNITYGQKLYLHALNTKRFISNTLLTASVPSSRGGYGFSGSQKDVHQAIYHRVIKGEIEFRHVVIIYHKQLLADTIFKLLLHDGFKFYIRHYEPPPKAIPVLNLVSFDDEEFFIGNFHTGSSAGYSKRLSIREPNLAEILKNYWQVHWSLAIPLNEGIIIDWTELRRIGTKLGMDDKEFDELVLQVKSEVQAAKRKFQR